MTVEGRLFHAGTRYLRYVHTDSNFMLTVEQ